MNKICKLTIRLILLSALFVLMSTSAYADTCTSNADGDWNDDSAIWDCLLDPNAVPVAGDDVVINDSVSFTADIAQVNDITIGNGGTLTQQNTNQQIITGDLTIESGGTLTQEINTTCSNNESYNNNRHLCGVYGGVYDSTHIYELNFKVNNLYLELGGTIDASAKGFDGGGGQEEGYGLGKGFSPGGGAGNGGVGADGSGSNGGDGGSDVCDVTSPDELGSGGGGSIIATNTRGGGGAGGGLIILESNNIISLYGTFNVAGQEGFPYYASNNRGGGGGSGGGIRLKADSLIGDSVIQADGGDGGIASSLYKYGGGGGGGCVLIEYYTSNSLTGDINLAGGSSGAHPEGADGVYSINQLNAALAAPEFSDSVYLLTLLTAFSLIYYFARSKIYL